VSQIYKKIVTKNKRNFCLFKFHKVENKNRKQIQEKILIAPLIAPPIEPPQIFCLRLNITVNEIIVM